MGEVGIELEVGTELEVGIEMTPEAAWTQLRRDWLWVSNGEDQKHRASEELGLNDQKLGNRELCFSAVGDDWFEQVARRRQQLTRYVKEHELNPSASAARIVMIADAKPVDFLAGLWAALLSGWSIALANAQWGHQEWQSAQALIQPQIIWQASGAPLLSCTPAVSTPHHSIDINHPAILIPTGGSSGQLKFTHHTWHTLSRSVAGFQQHFFPTPSPSQPSATPPPISAYCVLPLYHVSGLLQALRTALTHGQLFLSPFKTLISTDWPSAADARSATFISLVPTQLNRLLQAGKVPWLTQFHAVLLGGAPPWPNLLERAIAHKIPLCLSYGMTETAAMVSATVPNDCLETQDLSRLGSGHAMPHANIKIEQAGRSLSGRSLSGQPLPSQSLSVGEVGQVVVYSDAIALGYYNAPSTDFAPHVFYTDDLGYLDENGTLHITGRASGKIISGGENIFPAEVEAALRNTEQVHDVCIVGLPHPVWGEAVSAAYVPKDDTVSPESLKAALVRENIQNAGATVPPALSRYKVPKYWFPLPYLPRNEQGKINRSALLAQLKPLSNLSAQQAKADDGGSED